MEQVCRTCRFKGPALAQVGDLDDPGAAIVVDTGLSVCTALRHLGSVRVGPHDAILATTQERPGTGVADRSGHGAALCVDDEFGCRRWQAR